MLSVLVCRDSARRSIRPRPRIPRPRLAVGHLAAQPLACCSGADAVRRRCMRRDQPALGDVLSQLDTAFLLASNQAPRDRRMSASPLRSSSGRQKCGLFTHRIPFRSYGLQSVASTAAIATAVASTFDEFSPATHMRPERTRYTACSSRRRSTCSAVRPV